MRDPLDAGRTRELPFEPPLDLKKPPLDGRSGADSTGPVTTPGADQATSGKLPRGPAGKRRKRK